MRAGNSGLRKGTIDSYRWHLEHLGQWLVGHGRDEVETLDVKIIRRWGAELHEGRRLTTTRGGFAAARGLFRWLQKEGTLEVDLAASLYMPRPPECEQRTISQAEVGLLFRACGAPLHQEDAGDQELTVAARNVALVAVLFDSMVRASELCSLKVSDVDLEKGLLRVRSGKGGKSRAAPVGPDALLALQGVAAAAPGRAGRRQPVHIVGRAHAGPAADRAWPAPDPPPARRAGRAGGRVPACVSPGRCGGRNAGRRSKPPRPGLGRLVEYQDGGALHPDSPQRPGGAAAVQALRAAVVSVERAGLAGEPAG